MLENEIQQLEQDGVVTLTSQLDAALLDKLRTDLDIANEECEKIQAQNQVGLSKDSGDNAKGGDGSLKGVAHNIVCFGDSFLELLEARPGFDIMEQALDSKIILNSFSGVTNYNSEDMYEHAFEIHRDIRSFTEHYCQMFAMLIPLDDFTEDNGATLFIPGSHSMRDKPTQEYFQEHAVKTIAPAGSIIILDARIWHAAGKNLTDKQRRLLTLNFTRPHFKPQFDFVCSIGEEKCASLSDNLKQILGYYSRIPANHNDWYQKPEKRFYQSDQG